MAEKELEKQNLYMGQNAKHQKMLGIHIWGYFLEFMEQ